MNLFIALVLPLFLIVATIVTYTLANGIGPTPTNRRVNEQLREVLPGSVEGRILELGAGWGGIAIMLARQYPGNQIIAVENCPPVWLACWLRAKVAGTSNLQVKMGNIYQEDLEKVALIYCYLFPGAMKKLLTRLQFMQPGGIVISNTFSLPGVEPERVSLANDVWRSRLYFYRLSQ